MVVGVISDTHDRLEQLETALRFFQAQGVTTVVHCGDWKSLSAVHFCAELAAELGLRLRGVLGNNDLAVQGFLAYNLTAPGDFRLVEGILDLELAGKHIAVYHGHHLPTKRQLLADANYDVVLLGHSHKPLIESTGNRLLVNPGSTAFAIPRNKTWHPSVALLNLATMTATIEYLA